ncbi:hypothetical protein [Neorhizobium petrolearium]|uniref:hypothetical protein n=1 Tax=Neorhizobium petrolearium TaxID=515361 RepID=UPI003F7DAA91
MLVETKPAVPTESEKPCPAPVTLPNRAITAKETTDFWGADRSALRVCEQRRAAAVQALRRPQ